MLRQLEHVGIAVRSLAAAIPQYEKMLGCSCYKTEEVAAEKVRTAFFKTGSTKIELLEALAPDSPIHRFIEKRGEGLHHIAYLVKDMHQEMKRLQAEGFELLQTEPKAGADNKWVCFVHPRSVGGVLTELCQERS